MKHLFLILALFITFNCFSQDPQLFDTTWYLRNVVLSGEDNIPTREAILVFTGGMQNTTISLGMCKDFHGNEAVFDNVNSLFTVIDNGWVSGAGGCGNPTDNDYMLLYYNFYEDNDFAPFAYAITPEGDDLALVVTAQNGDQAFYGDVLLGTVENVVAELVVYPIPVNDKLFIAFKNQDFINATFKIMDITGKEVMGATVDSTTDINVQGLQNGVYFVMVTIEDGSKMIQRFIKE